MDSIYKNIQDTINKGEKLLAVLIDPDKFSIENTSSFIEKVNRSIATHIFVGGSIVNDKATDGLVSEIKKHTILPIVLFPGDVSQITDKADALLFLSLLSGRNSEYLIGKHVEAVSKLKNTSLEVISTGYILIESGKKTAVEKVTDTKPVKRENVQHIIDTAKAGQFLGMKLIYLEAGSGAKTPLTRAIIEVVKNELQIPLIVGGGIRTKLQIENAYNAGADIVVIGTAFEEDESFFEEIKKKEDILNIIKIEINQEFKNICKEILNRNFSVSQWAEIESSDEFQTENYCGGFDATEMEFCFSYFKDKEEFWFQKSLLEIERILNEEVNYLQLRQAEKE